MRGNWRTWLVVVGLFLDLVGAAIVTYASLVTPEQAATAGAAYWGSGDPSQDVTLPMAQNLLRQASASAWGMAFVTTGFLCQLIASWPKRRRGRSNCDTSLRLTVHQLDKVDVYRDMVRIPEQFRIDTAGRRIAEGSFCELTVGRRSALVIARGAIEHAADPWVMMDDVTRTRLNVERDTDYDVRLRQLRWFERPRWVWGASDPGYRISGQMALVSLFLGIIGLLFGLASLYAA